MLPLPESCGSVHCCSKKRELRTLSKSGDKSHALQSVEIDGQALQIFNDLETPVFAKYTLLPVMKNWLRSRDGVLAAAMSGSGSTLFAILREGRDAEALAVQLRAKFGETLWVHY